MSKYTWKKLFALAAVGAVSTWMSGSAYAAPSTSAPYPLNTCPVSGQELGSMGEPVVKTYEGREVRFCCAGCVDKFEADQATYTGKIDAAIVDQQKDAYPLETCPISGEKLGSMGAPVDVVHDNRLVRLCCAGCEPKLDAKAEAVHEQIDQAVVAAQKDSYPLDVCVVSGEKLGKMGEPAPYVVGDQLFLLCCGGCAKKIEAAPATYLSKLEK